MAVEPFFELHKIVGETGRVVVAAVNTQTKKAQRGFLALENGVVVFIPIGEPVSIGQE